MGRALGGFLIGFFLATFIFFLFVQIQLGPLENDIKTVEPYVKTTYEITHTELYGVISGFASTISGVANQLAGIPFIGSALSATNIPAATNGIAQLLTSAKVTSEKALPIIQAALLLITVSMPAMVISIIFMIVGFFILVKAPKAKTRQNDSESTGEVKFCGKCGNKLASTARFCGKCGEKA